LKIEATKKIKGLEKSIKENMIYLDLS